MRRLSEALKGLDVEEMAERHWRRIDKIHRPRPFGPHGEGDCYQAEVDLQKVLTAYMRLREIIEEVQG